MGRNLLWLLPPFRLVGQVLNKLLEEQADAILILPAWVCFWQDLLKRLPVIDQQRVDYHKSVFILGSRLPKEVLKNPPRFRLMAYLVRSQASL